MEIAEATYKGGASYKNTQLAEADRESFGRKKKGGGSATAYNPKKGCAVKNKKIDVGRSINTPNVAKYTCMFHGTRHSYEA